MTDYQRMTDVAGFTIVYRKGRAARVHLLRPWNSCNTEHRKAGRDTVTVEGSRENLLMTLDGRRAIECKRCFPAPRVEDEPTGEIAYADPIPGI